MPDNDCMPMPSSLVWFHSSIILKHPPPPCQFMEQRKVYSNRRTQGVTVKHRAQVSIVF
ncbi:unnamed protein product, partial [Musa acuminata subsp. burmannicoides]